MISTGKDVMSKFNDIFSEDNYIEMYQRHDDAIIELIDNEYDNVQAIVNKVTIKRGLNKKQQSTLYEYIIDAIDNFIDGSGI